MTVGELKKKLAQFAESDEVVIVVNTGDVGIPGSLDGVGYSVDERTVNLVHVCDFFDNPSELDVLVDSAMS